ncbi:SDR family oxidoreductase [Sphingobacterium ginsenosidimutans]|uniref:3-oxoacyl-[acyl-carrier-protein] reductase n=1 Tax=Sphingobacterium ginsenosidimutans TaxID=687845 RepID=A0ABP7ZQS1_9SPHI
MKKYALVTGGTKGIGKGIVEKLLRRGYHVITTYRKDETARDSMLVEFKRFEDQLLLLKLDHSDNLQTLRLTTYIKENVPYLNCIVCNAGQTVRKDLRELSLTDWNTVMDVTLTSHFIIIRELIDLIASNARIVFVGSLMGLYPHAKSLPYGVSKAALHALAQNLVKEFSDTETTVNTIVPGFVETDWQKDKSIEMRQNIVEKTAIKRFATVNEITNACMFCIDNEFVNGAMIEMSGGYCFK